MISSVNNSCVYILFCMLLKCACAKLESFVDLKWSRIDWLID